MSSERAVWVLATCDTKGVEAAWVVQRLRTAGVTATLVDTGCIGEPAVRADVSREEVFRAAGTTREALVAGGDRGAAVNAAARGVEALACAAHAEGRLAGVLGLGGSAGTQIGTAAMRALPLGVPKLMVSTLASGDVRAYVRDKDVLMLSAVVDIAGLNRISRNVLASAAAAMVGLVTARAPIESSDDRPLVAATMFGVTTPCVDQARRVLEEAGYEVLVFHATGNGGEALESLVRDGVFAGVLDITTTELADELVGGVLSAGPTRLTAAAETGTPQVVSVGALDMVNFRARHTVPDRFEGRTFHVHNAEVTLMRTTPEENALLGAEIGRKVAASTGPAAILLPAQGVSAIDRAGQSFDDPAAREALFEAIRANAGPVEVVELQSHLNDAAFAEAAARALIERMGARPA
jgi:uncharacterized protein (UPF0261 family)